MNINITEITEDGAKEVTMEELKTRHQEKFFQFIHTCSSLLGIDGKVLIEDPSWFFCFDDGLTPEEAVAEYKDMNNVTS